VSHARGEHESVARLERDRLGGTCLNRGCIPSKALLETAELLHRVTEQGAEFGLAGHDGISLDYGALAKRRDSVIDKHVGGVEFLMKKNKITVLRGNGVLTGPTSVRVSGGEAGDIEATADNLILATGSAPRSLPGLDPDGRLIITSDEALERNDVPKRVTIVGAGAIGVEWASMYRDFGAEVTLVEFADRIVPLEDPEVGKELARVFKKRGMAIHAASAIDPETIKKSENEVSFQIATKEDDERTEIVLLYLESFGNPRRFGRIARRVAGVKPVIAVKSGRSAAGARAAASRHASGRSTRLTPRSRYFHSSAPFRQM